MNADERQEDSWCDACEKWTPDEELSWWFGELICEECVEDRWANPEGSTK